MVHLVHALRGAFAPPAASRMSPAMNSMSFSTSREPARAPARIVVEHAHAVCRRAPAPSPAPEPMKPEPPVTRMRLTRAASWRAPASTSIHRALLVRALRGVDQLLHAVALGEIRLAPCRRSRWRRGNCLASRDTGAMRPSGYCASSGSLDRDARRAPPPAAWRATARSRACSRRSDCAAPACRPRRRIRCGGRRRDRRRSSSTGWPAARPRIAAPWPRWSAGRSSSGQAGQRAPTSRAIGPPNHSR